MNAVQPSALIVSPFGERGDHSCFYCQVPTRRPKLPVVGRVHDHAFVPADVIRDALAAAGIELRDTPDGPRWDVTGGE